MIRLAFCPLVRARVHVRTRRCFQSLQLPQTPRVNYDQALQTQSDLDGITPEDISSLDVKSMVNLMFHAGRKNYKMNQDQIEEFAMNLSKQDVRQFNAQSVSNLMYGLHIYDSEGVAMGKLLMAIVYKISACDEELRAQHVGNCLYGLQGMDIKKSPVRKLILMLAEKIDSCTEELSKLDFGNTMYALRNMSSGYEEVRYLLHVLTSKLESCEEPLDSHAVQISLYGLTSMRSRHDEVLRILLVLTEKIEQLNCNLSQNALGALYGLKNLYSDKVEVRQLVQALSDKVERSVMEDINPILIASALFGLQNMQAKSEEVRSLVAAMVSKIEHNCIGVFPPPVMDVALRGIRAMSSDYAEVRAMIGALAKRLGSNQKFECNTEYFVSIASSLSLKSCEYVEIRLLYEAYISQIQLSSQQYTVKDISKIFTNIGYLASNQVEMVKLFRVLDTKLVDATPDNIDISPIMRSLRFMPQSETWVVEMMEHIFDRVSSTDNEHIKPRDIMHALSFMSAYTCESPHIENLVLCILKKFDAVWRESSENEIYTGVPVRLQVIGGLVGIGMEKEYVTAAYLQFVKIVLVSSLRPDETTTDHLCDIMFYFQTMVCDHESQSGKCLVDICSHLYGLLTLVDVKDSRVDVKRIAAALYGLQGLLSIPSNNKNENNGPGDELCVFLVKKLRNVLSTDGNEINWHALHENTTFVLQHLILFEHLCGECLKHLGIEDDMAFIISKLDSKLNTANHQEKIFRPFCAQGMPTEAEINHFMKETSLNSAIDINVIYKHGFANCFPAPYVVQTGKYLDAMGNPKYNPTKVSYNIDTSVHDGPFCPVKQNLSKHRDEFLNRKYNSKTIRCAATSLQHEVVYEALQATILELVNPLSHTDISTSKKS